MSEFMDYSLFQHPAASGRYRRRRTRPLRALCRQQLLTVLPAILLVMLPVIITLHTSAQAASKAAVGGNTDITEDIENYRDQLRRLQRGIEEQQGKKEESTRNEKNILEELEDIDNRLKEQQRKVADLLIKVQLQQMLIDLKQDEITTLQSEREKVLSHLRKRSGAYYKMGKVGFLNVTFSSQSLPDLLKFHDAFQALITHDKDVITHYRQKIGELRRARNAHTLELQLLQEFMTTAQTETDKIDQIRAEKAQLLTRIRTEKHLHEQAAKEMEAASEDLSKTLISLKTKEQSQEQTFARRKGRLRVPVKGQVITYFNQEKTNKLGILRKSSGIAIEAPDGAKVQAVAEGTVIFSGYLRGYGNTVIIHHGYQYYTVTSRLEKILPKAGDPVKSGSTIGWSSDTTTLIEEGLYFEIRHGKESLDPLEWLDNSRLQITKPLPVLNQG